MIYWHVYQEVNTTILPNVKWNELWLQCYFHVTCPRDLNTLFNLECYIAAENAIKWPVFGSFFVRISLSKDAAQSHLRPYFTLIMRGSPTSIKTLCLLVQNAVQSHYNRPSNDYTGILNDMAVWRFRETFRGTLRGTQFMPFKNEMYTLGRHLGGQKRVKLCAVKRR